MWWFVLLISNRIDYYNLIFAGLHLWPLQLLMNNPVFCYNSICCFSTERHIQSKWIILSYDHRSILKKYILEIKRLICLTSNFLGFDFYLDRSFYCVIRKPVLDFKSIFYWNFSSISYLFEDIWLQSFKGISNGRNIFDLRWPFTFRGHLRSKIFLPFESPYITSYLVSIDTFSLSRTVFDIFDFNVFWVSTWLLTIRYSKAHTLLPI